MYEKECLDSQKQYKFDKHSFNPPAASVEDDAEKICNVPFYLSGLKQKGECISREACEKSSKMPHKSRQIDSLTLLFNLTSLQLAEGCRYV